MNSRRQGYESARAGRDERWGGPDYNVVQRCRGSGADPMAMGNGAISGDLPVEQGPGSFSFWSSICRDAKLSILAPRPRP
jgi:hypothetical protein